MGDWGRVALNGVIIVAGWVLVMLAMPLASTDQVFFLLAGFFLVSGATTLVVAPSWAALGRQEGNGRVFLWAFRTAGAVFIGLALLLVGVEILG